MGVCQLASTKDETASVALRDREVEKKEDSMRKRVVLTIALVIALCAAVVGRVLAVEPPIVVRSGNVEMTIQGTGWPDALPKHKLAPISFKASGKIATVDGTHPPALEEVIVDVGERVGVNAGQFPTCTKQEIAATSTEQAERSCHDAIIGRGSGKVEVEFAEQKPFTATGPLVIFNGGEKDGKAMFLVHAYVAVPSPTAIVTTVVLTKEHKGPYRLHAVGTIPPIAGGAGSVTGFSMSLDRKGYFVAACNNGHFSIKVSAKYHDGTRVKGGFIRTCTGI